MQALQVPSWQRQPSKAERDETNIMVAPDSEPKMLCIQDSGLLKTVDTHQFYHFINHI